MRILKLNTNIAISILMTSSEDHVTGIVSLSPFTARISKDGGAFQVAAIDVTEIGNGWYSVNLTQAETNTVGDLILHLTATGADPTDILMTVTADDFETLALKVDEIYTLLGLKLGTPSATTTTERIAGDITIALSGDGVTSTTLTRQ